MHIDVRFKSHMVKLAICPSHQLDDDAFLFLLLVYQQMNFQDSIQPKSGHQGRLSFFKSVNNGNYPMVQCHVEAPNTK